MNPRSLSHVALGVRDYERSLHFYRDLLGLSCAMGRRLPRRTA